MKLTLTEATNHDKKKDGSPMLDNRGRQKYRSVIKTVEKGNDFLSGFVFRPLSVGDVIEAEVTTEMYNNRPQLKFALVASPEKKAEVAQNNSDTMRELKNHTVLLGGILNQLEAIYMSISTHQTIDILKKKPKEAESVSKLQTTPLTQEPNFDIAATEVKDENDYGDLSSEFPG